MSAPEPLECHGLGAGEGIAVGRACIFEHEVTTVHRFELDPGDEMGELERFRVAVDRAQEEIRETGHRVRQQLGNELAAIFEAHSLFLADRLFLGRIEERIRSRRINAEWAVHRTAVELGERFAAFESPHLRERSEDLQDVSRYLLRSLQEASHREPTDFGEDAIIVATDLTPSATVRLGRQGVIGFAIESGGETSHTAIIARSLHIPLVVGATGITSQVREDDELIVDGSEGKVIVHPPEDLSDDYRRRAKRFLSRRRRLATSRSLAAVTSDGIEVSLLANIDLPEEIDDAIEVGLTGVGLYRSEFLYIERSPEMPSEDEHVALYKRLLEAMHPHPVVVRTYDLGGRKLASEVIGTAESNPVLGLRGIRLTLSRPEFFRVQVRALYRAAVHGDLRIMLPMVSNVEEVEQFRAIADTARQELRSAGIPFCEQVKIGIMIEVPSAALVADLMAPKVDFFSIGTNDLIQYSLAVDRNNEHVNYLYRPFHPAILRMIRFVVDSADAAGIDVSICGEMAGDPAYIPMLLGLGLRRLSVGPHTVPTIKEKIRETSAAQCREAIGRCLDLATAEEVEGLFRPLQVTAEES